MQSSINNGVYMFTFTAFRLNLNGSLSHREELNNENELGDFLDRSYGVHANVIVVRSDGNALTFTDNGEWFEIIKKEKGFSI